MSISRNTLPDNITVAHKAFESALKTVAIENVIRFLADTQGFGSDFQTLPYEERLEMVYSMVPKIREMQLLPINKK